MKARHVCRWELGSDDAKETHNWESRDPPFFPPLVRVRHRQKMSEAKTDARRWSDHKDESKYIDSRWPASILPPDFLNFLSHSLTREGRRCVCYHRTVSLKMSTDVSTKQKFKYFFFLLVKWAFGDGFPSPHKWTAMHFRLARWLGPLHPIMLSISYRCALMVQHHVSLVINVQGAAKSTFFMQDLTEGNRWRPWIRDQGNPL